MKDRFPLTIKMLKEFVGTGGGKLFQDLEGLPSHQVPMFLREQGLSAEICEIAYYESLKAFVENENQGTCQFSPLGIALNSSLQWIEISAAAEVLGKKPGIYALWRKDNSFHELSLTKKQAGLLDQLMDDLLPIFSEEDEKELADLECLGIIYRDTVPS